MYEARGTFSQSCLVCWYKSVWAGLWLCSCRQLSVFSGGVVLHNNVWMWEGNLSPVSRSETCMRFLTQPKIANCTLWKRVVFQRNVKQVFMGKLSREWILPLEEEWEMVMEPGYGIKHADCFLDRQNYSDLGGKHFSIAGQQAFSLAAQCDTHHKWILAIIIRFAFC